MVFYHPTAAFIGSQFWVQSQQTLFPTGWRGKAVTIIKDGVLYELKKA